MVLWLHCVHTTGVGCLVLSTYWLGSGAHPPGCILQLTRRDLVERVFAGPAQWLVSVSE